MGDGIRAAGITGRASGPALVGLAVVALAVAFAAQPAVAQVHAGSQSPGNRYGQTYVSPSQLRAMLLDQMRNSPEWQEAREEWIAARDEWQLAREQLNQRLTSNGEFLSLRSQVWTLEEQIFQLHEQYRHGVVPQERLLNLANRMLEHRVEMNRIRRSYTDNLPALADARSRYFDAGRRMVEIRREMEEQIRMEIALQRHGRI